MIRARISAPASTTSKTRSDLGESGKIRSSKATPPARIAIVIAGDNASVSDSAQTQVLCCATYRRVVARIHFFTARRRTVQTTKTTGPLIHAERKTLALKLSEICWSILTSRRCSSNQHSHVWIFDAAIREMLLNVVAPFCGGT